MLAEASLLVALTVQHGSGAEACLDARRLERSVERRLKRRVFVPPAEADLRFVITFEKHGGEIEARIELASIDGTPRGTRSLVTSSHCSALDDSLALSVALLVDQPPDPEPPLPPPSAPRSGPTAGAQPETPAPPAVVTPPRRKPTPIHIPDDVAAPREPLHVSAGVSALGTWGLLPGIDPALALYLELVPRHFYPVVLQGEGFWPAEAERDVAAGARFRLFRAGLLVCPPVVEASRSVLSVCAGQKLGFIRAGGFGFDHNRDERRLTFALSLGAEGKLRLFPAVSVRGYLGAEVPVVRDRFASGGRNSTDLFQPSPVAAAAEIGLESRLW